MPEKEYEGTLTVREDGGWYYVTFSPVTGGSPFNLGKFAGAPDEVADALKEWLFTRK